MKNEKINQKNLIVTEQMDHHRRSPITTFLLSTFNHCRSTEAKLQNDNEKKYFLPMTIQCWRRRKSSRKNELFHRIGNDIWKFWDSINSLQKVNLRNFGIYFMQPAVVITMSKWKILSLYTYRDLIHEVEGTA